MRSSARCLRRWLGRTWAVRLVQSGIVAVLAVVMLGAESSRFERLGHAMICTCGCNQILLECNHVGCTSSAAMIGELREQLASGGPDTTILNWFVAKYGPVVLAAPTQSGFGAVAWVTPLAAFGLATLGTGAIVWAWRRRTVRLAGPIADWHGTHPTPIDSESEALRERIRRETEYQ